MAPHPDDQRRNGQRPEEHREFPPSPATMLLYTLGAVGTAVRQARELRENAKKLPMAGLTFAIEQATKITRDYPKYLAQGMLLVQKIASSAAQAGAQGARSGFPTGTVEPPGGQTVEEEAREVAERARGAVEKAKELRRAAPAAEKPAAPKPAAEKPAAEKPAAPKTRAAAKQAAPAPEKPVAEKPAAPAPQPEIAEAAREVGAPGAAAEAVEEAVQEVEAASGAEPDGAALHPDQLVEPELDHLSVPALRGRLRRFDIAGLVQLRAYEQAHANRLQVVTMLENRIAKLEAEARPAS